MITTGWQPRAPAARPGRRAPAFRSGARSSWPGGSADPAKVVPWLGITGTNGKTTTTQMLESILSAAGLRTAAVGNIGRPIMETVLDPEPYDVLAVELSSHQLHWSNSLALHSAAVLNLQPDHLRVARRPRGLRGRQGEDLRAACRPAASTTWPTPRPSGLVEEADVVEGARAIGFTLGTPGPSMLGVVDDLLVDRAFIEQRRDSALELASVTDISPAAPHNVANALAAAALARSYGVPASAVRDGLRNGADRCAQDPDRRRARRRALGRRLQGHQPARRRRGTARVRRRWSGSPAGRPRARPSTPGQPAHRDRLRGAVLLGVDREVIAEALARHAPEVPVIAIAATKLVPWRRPSRRPSRWPGPAMRCSWPRVAPAWTCTPGTPPVGTRSPRRYANSTVTRATRAETSRKRTAWQLCPRDHWTRTLCSARPDRVRADVRPTKLAPAAVDWVALDAGPAADQLPPGARRRRPCCCVVGMMMVLSASSVNAYVTYDDSYYYVKRQAFFLVRRRGRCSW